jgi:hypothetical protein
MERVLEHFSPAGSGGFAGSQKDDLGVSNNLVHGHPTRLSTAATWLVVVGLIIKYLFRFFILFVECLFILRKVLPRIFKNGKANAPGRLKAVY